MFSTAKSEKVSQNCFVFDVAPWCLWWKCLLYCAYHGKCIFADPLQFSNACHRFRNCHKTLMFCSLLTRCTIPCTCHAKRHLNLQKWSEHVVVLFGFWLCNVLRAAPACTFSTSQLPKVVRAWCVLCILTLKCASRHTGVHFFDVSTSKNAPELRGFVHFVYFDLEMCFAPQRRALFHLSSGQPRTRRFSEPDFRPSGATNHWKNTVLWTFLPVRAPGSSFTETFLFDLLFLLFSSLTLTISAFHLSILSQVWLLNFGLPPSWAQVALSWTQPSWRQ